MSTLRATTLCLVLIAFGPLALAGQSRAGLEPGDSIRFNVPTVIEFRDASGAVESVETLPGGVAGRVLFLDRDTLVIDQAGTERRVALTSVEDVRVRREIGSPHGTGFKRGATFGGAILGAVGAGIGFCNPDIFGSGCQGGADAGLIMSTTLVGAAVGGLAGGLLGALFAPSHRWESVQVSLPVPQSDGSVALGVRVASPR